MELTTSRWSIVYEKAIRDDGSLFFPDRIDHQFLEDAKKTMGTMLFANQYLNEIFPADDAKFRKEWFKYSTQVPDNVYHFAMVDPAISTKDGADYTGVVVVAVDHQANWYVKHASRQRLNPTQIVNLVFTLNSQYPNMMAVGVEAVAYQKALLYMIQEESLRRQMVVPLKELQPPSNMTKEMRIMGLIPRFEWGRIYLSPGLDDLERELLQFPRSAHDDVVDALAYLENLVFYPEAPRRMNENPHPNNPEYERQLVNYYAQKANDDYGSDL